MKDRSLLLRSSDVWVKMEYGREFEEVVVVGDGRLLQLRVRTMAHGHLHRLLPVQATIPIQDVNT